MPERMVNEAEKYYNMEFSPLAIKRTIDGYINQVGTGNLQLVKQDERFNVWINSDGHTYNASAAVIESETYFPFIDNPLQCLNLMFRHSKTYDQ